MHAFDRQTDRQTDRNLIVKTALHSMQRGNKTVSELVCMFKVRFQFLLEPARRYKLLSRNPMADYTRNSAVLGVPWMQTV